MKTGINLTLFFSKNVSLNEWHATGMFNREVAIYREHAQNGIQPTFITYDTDVSEAISRSIPFAKTAGNLLKLPEYFYYTLLPIIHGKILRETDIIKTNQVSGSLPAIQAARIYQKPLLARCGYLRSEFMKEKYGADSRRTKRALKLEQKLFSDAQAIIVTTDAMKQSILNRIPAAQGKINVIPNYVNTNIFKPVPIEKEYDVIFIGRFSEQKNLTALLEAITNVQCSALIIGTASSSNELKKRFPSPKIQWETNLPNHELPDKLNKARLFVLPSHYEGHPKVLIEAMSCGCAIIGTNVQGIRNVVENQQTGVLTQTDPASLTSAIKELLENEQKRIRLGASARHFAVEHYSLQKTARTEANIIRRLSTSIPLNRKT